MGTLQLLTQSKNNVDVSYDPVGSHAATHFNDTPGLKDLVIEAIQKIDLFDEDLKVTVDLGRVIGGKDIVAVHDGDTVIYGIRKLREVDGLVPFVKNRERDPSSTIALHLIRHEDTSYELSSAWVGDFDDDEPFPLSPDATSQSAGYWSNNAFVYGSQEIVTGTETSVRPW